MTSKVLKFNRELQGEVKRLEGAEKVLQNIKETEKEIVAKTRVSVFNEAIEIVKQYEKEKWETAFRQQTDPTFQGILGLIERFEAARDKGGK